jgi:hypothetical protein
MNIRSARQVSPLLLPLVVGCERPPRVSSTRGNNAMPDLWEVRHISVSIHRPPHEVYAFASQPENLPKWASGVAGGITQVDGQWVAEAPFGRVTLKFTEPNRFGVLDHDVTQASGVTTHNPIRVLPNGNGSEVIFSLFRQPQTTDSKFAADADWVMKDLTALKALLESTGT